MEKKFFRKILWEKKKYDSSFQWMDSYRKRILGNRSSIFLVVPFSRQPSIYRGTKTRVRWQWRNEGEARVNLCWLGYISNVLLTLENNDRAITGAATPANRAATTLLRSIEPRNPWGIRQELRRSRLADSAFLLSKRSTYYNSSFVETKNKNVKIKIKLQNLNEDRENLTIRKIGK